MSVESGAVFVFLIELAEIAQIATDLFRWDC
jgi:hypothetical protein